MQRILIVEDEDVIRNSLSKLLERNGYQVAAAGNIQEATNHHELANFSLIISDLRLPGSPGTELIKPAGDVPVLIMTSYASLRSAVDTMKLGAVDYIPKPFDQREMLNAVKRILRAQPRPREFQSPTHASQGMIGDSLAMKEVFNIIHKVAPTDATVLIHGETGTGKELAARAIHNESRRADGPLVCVNCAAIPDTLIEAELFGHAKGSFTGAVESRTGLVTAADGGTLFLDEIGELPLEAQARLLRVLQEGEVRPIGTVTPRKVNVRLLAATHRNLHKLCRENRFREDLYYRINVVNLDLPALRERGKDILGIAEHLLEKFCAKLDKPRMEFAPDAIQAITTYAWPGNIREMENSIQRAVILCDEGQAISHDLLGISLSLVEIDADAGSETPPADPAKARDRTLKEIQEGLSLEDYFTHFVLENQDSMSETQLAKKLGISRKCLWERRQKLGIPRSKSA